MHWLNIPEYGDLVEKAEKLGIKTGNKTAAELYFEISETNPDENTEIYVFKREYSSEDLAEMAANNIRPAGSVVMPKAMRKQVMRTIAKHPRAFSNYCFGNPANKLQLVYETSLTCHCGEPIQMVREWKDKDFDRNIEIEKKAIAHQVQCPACQTMYVLVEKPELEKPKKVTVSD